MLISRTFQVRIHVRKTRIRFLVTDDTLLETNLLKMFYWPWTFKEVFLWLNFKRTKKNSSKFGSNQFWVLPKGTNRLPVGQPSSCIKDVLGARSSINWQKYILWSTQRVFSSTYGNHSKIIQTWSVERQARMSSPVFSQRASKAVKSVCSLSRPEMSSKRWARRWDKVGGNWIWKCLPKTVNNAAETTSHSTEVAFVLLTQPAWVRFSASREFFAEKIAEN